jgi:hypothetical protein
MAYNPRFPYTLQVLRAELDENGEPVFDENANPSFETLVFDVADYDGQMPKRGKDGTPVTQQMSTIPFGYRQQTANAVINGDVIIAEMKIACPLILGEIRTKDVLEMTDDDRTFRAEVVRKINTNFGTNIWYNEVKQ